jgi:hypothetical protein
MAFIHKQMRFISIKDLVYKKVGFKGSTKTKTVKIGKKWENWHSTKVSCDL